MIFAYIIKQIVQQWSRALAKNQMAQYLVAQETPSIQVAKQMRALSATMSNCDQVN